MSTMINCLPRVALFASVDIEISWFVRLRWSIAGYVFCVYRYEHTIVYGPSARLIG